MTLLWIVGLVLFASFLLIVVRGAPYVPTHSGDIERLFGLYTFKPGDVLVDLGSGDGRVLSAAASRGIQAVGYELNPFLAVYSMVRLRRHSQVSVKMTDFWLSSLPDNTVVVFVFLAGPFMAKLDRHLQREAQRLGHEVTLISYGMKITDRTPSRTEGGFICYQYKA